MPPRDQITFRRIEILKNSTYIVGISVEFDYKFISIERQNYISTELNCLPSHLVYNFFLSVLDGIERVNNYRQTFTLQRFKNLPSFISAVVICHNQKIRDFQNMPRE